MAVTANALFGALIGVRAKFDAAGILALGILTGVGGGILRDILLNLRLLDLRRLNNRRLDFQLFDLYGFRFRNFWLIDLYWLN